MKGIRWFQRFMITLLVAVNAFVFMSMRQFDIRANLLYTIGLLSIIFIILFIIGQMQRSKKKKTIPDSQD